MLVMTLGVRTKPGQRKCSSTAKIMIIRKDCMNQTMSELNPQLECTDRFLERLKQKPQSRRKLIQVESSWKLRENTLDTLISATSCCTKLLTPDSNGQDGIM
jgi:hypothetical protein